MKSTDDSYLIEKKYQKGIDYEQILLQQISRIAKYRSEKDIERYEESVDTLIYMLPPDLREKALEYKKKKNVRYNISGIGKQAYDELWQTVNDILKKANLIYKTSYIKTYE